MTSSTVSNSPLALSEAIWGKGAEGGIGALITRIARRYTLPPKCAIIRDDLVQEGCLGYLEAQITHPDADEKKWRNYARKAMQKAIIAYISPVTRSLDTVLYTDATGNPITLSDTIADTPTDADSNLSLAPERPPVEAGGAASAEDGYACEIGAFLSSLDAQLAAGSITPANYRQKKHRFLKKLRRQVSQNRDSPV